MPGARQSFAAYASLHLAWFHRNVTVAWAMDQLVVARAQARITLLRLQRELDA